MNAEPVQYVSRRFLWVSAALALLLLLAMGAFLVLRGRTAPLWVTRHSATPSLTP